MQFFIKSFPKLKTFIILCILFSCKSEDSNIIEEAKFIEFYSRLLIIQEMRINDEKYAHLVEKLMQAYQISGADLKQTVQYYQRYPEKWVNILSKIRNRLDEFRTKRKPIK